jgi:hypothetical protein
VAWISVCGTAPSRRGCDVSLRAVACQDRVGARRSIRSEDERLDRAAGAGSAYEGAGGVDGGATAVSENAEGAGMDTEADAGASSGLALASARLIR